MHVKFAMALTVGLWVLAVAAASALILPEVWAAEHAAAAAGTVLEGSAWGWGFLAAAIATGMSAAGAGYAVAKVGSAATGALAEKPELLGRLLILVGLAEGIAIYGIIIAVLILNALK
ncbi:MAG: ATP synthase subunit C [Gammaproteobacteria bacterium]|nr:ATP synthase subunit C [Gammaproteobacteria bacterium]